MGSSQSGRAPSQTRGGSPLLHAVLLLALDGAALSAAVGAARWLGPGVELALFVLLTLCLQAYGGLYQARLPFQREAERSVHAVTVAGAGAAAMVLLWANWPWERVARLGGVWLLAFLLLPASRYLGRRLAAGWAWYRTPVLVAGSLTACQVLARAIAREPQLGYTVVGGLTENPADVGSEVGTDRGRAVSVVGSVDEPGAVIARYDVQAVFLAAGPWQADHQAAMVHALHQQVDVVHQVPCDRFCTQVPDLTCLLFGQERVLRSGGRYQAGGMAMKRGLDLAAGLLLLPPVLVLMGLLALVIRLDSAGPILFCDRRLGRGGRLYPCYKFRTMRVNSDAILEAYLQQNPRAQAEWRQYRKLREYDPRVTRVGVFLRKWSVDEIPQLFNVLRGEMSLVGPRPYRTSELPIMGAGSAAILAVKPGIAGLWQVMGRNEIPFEQRLLIDAWYVRNWSPWMDLVLIMRTVGAVLLRRGAY